jgi:hypothetical protein
VKITNPTIWADITSTSSSVSIGGTASDNIGVTQVTWANDRGGAGTAAGTGNWSVASLALQPGDNVITVTARDAAGNRATDVLTVTYSAPAPPPAASIVLSGRMSTSGRWVRAYLNWSGAQGGSIDVYRNGTRVSTTSNDGSTTDSPRGFGLFSYRVCVAGTSVCSNTVTLSTTAAEAD